MDVVSISEENDKKTVDIVVESTSGYADAFLLKSGNRFILASCYHRGTARTVLLTIARPNHGEATAQLKVVRSLIDAAADARIGSTLDRLWDRDEQSGWACLVSSFHPGLVPAAKVLVAVDNRLPKVDVIELLYQVADQLRIIHAAGFAHGDISLENVGVDENGAIHLIDFDNSVDRNTQLSTLAYTPGFGHPEKRMSGMESTWQLEDHQRWDLFAVGKLFMDVMSMTDPHHYPSLTPRMQRAIRLLGCMLLDGKNQPTEIAIGLPLQFFAENRITSIDQLCLILRLLSGSRRMDDEIPELRVSLEDVVEVGGPAPSAFTDRVRSIVDREEFRYLETFNQLGLISYIWPKATHKRYVHVLGTFGMCCQVINALLADRHNPLFAILISAYHVRVLLLAALLHDIGHYPIAHDVEEASHIDFDHEYRSVEILMSEAWTELLKVSENHGGWGVASVDVASVIEGGVPKTGSTLTRDVCALMHSVISGSLDVDKLDYLARDSNALDVKAGEGIDLKRILAGVTVALVKRASPGNDGLYPVFAVTEKARRPAEMVGRVRSHMFGVAYWHHSYRSIKAMLHWCIWRALIPNENATAAELRRSFSRYRLEFSKYLDRLTHAHVKSMPTLDFDTEATWTLGTPSAMPQAEESIFQWWAERSTADGREMFLLLRQHRWYKSVFEIQHPSVTEILQSTDALDADVRAKGVEIWAELEKVADSLRAHPKKQIVFRIRLAQALQREMRDWLLLQREGNAGTVVRDFKSQRDRFITSCDKSQMLLVDCPDTSRAFQKPLFFTISESRRQSTIDAKLPIKVSASYDSSRLNEEFVASNGVVRALCHPQFCEFIQQAVAPVTFFEMLRTAIQSARK